MSSRVGWRAITVWLARLARRATVRHFELHGTRDDAPVNTAASLLAIVVLIIGLDIALHMLGIRLTALFAAGGAFALAAGFAMKSIVESFLAGIMIRVERILQPGDIVEVNGQWLKIEKLGARITSGTTDEGEQVLIPNSTVAQSMVTSLTRGDRLYRIVASIAVAYSSDLDLVRSTLEEVVAGLEWSSAAGEPEVRLMDIGPSSIYEVLVWIDDVALARQRRSDLNEAIRKALKKAGIELALKPKPVPAT